GAEEIGRGNLDYRIEVRGRDEIGHLSRAFDQMAEALKTTMSSRDELNREIAERKRVEEALRETRDYLENLINYANAPIIVWDSDFKITRFNHAFEHLTDYTADEVIGQELSVLFPGASRDESLSKIARTLAGEYWEAVEIPILRKDGNIRIALWNSANIYAEDGTTLLTIMAQGQDITDRMKTEEELRAANQQLDANNQQLRASEQQLKAANQQLGASNQQLKASEQQLKAANQQLDASNQQLTASEQQLKASNQQLQASEQQLKASNQQLLERVKELNCFYGISKIVEIPDISLEEIFQRTVELIPASWQYPEITVCRMIINSKEYKTRNFKKTEWKQNNDIFVDNEKVGSIEIYQLKKMPDSNEEPFLKEERSLLNAIAERLGQIVERKKSEEKIKHLNRVLRAIRNVNQFITKEKDRDRLIKRACENLVATRGYFNAWIALLDESGKFITFAEDGLDKDFLPIIELMKSGKITACGKNSFKKKDVVIIENPLIECKDCPLSVKYANRSAMTIRLEYEGKIYGFMSVSIPEELIKDDEEFSLFKEVTGDISFALYSIEVEKERKQAEEELKKHREHLEELVKERTTELEKKNAELERFNNLFVGREFRIKELRDKIKELERKYKQP
ncbi:MAG: PAS domain S-box protein, partial [Bacteroidetes bacterium]|nr:PAS domain S-box protein [Bacteroidota bacterium]